MEVSLYFEVTFSILLSENKLPCFLYATTPYTFGSKSYEITRVVLEHEI